MGNPHRIVLLGPKHAGKTSAGSFLARSRRGEFIDLDGLMEQQTGESPRALYRADPGRFREAELRALEAALDSSAAPVRVIAAGGGIIDNDAAVELLKTSGAGLVYLEVSAETAWERIARSGAGLPPFLNTENPRETHRKLHERRAAAYKRLSHITVSGEQAAPDAVGGEIDRLLRRLSGPAPLIPPGE
jgi:shikimate kinase